MTDIARLRPEDVDEAALLVMAANAEADAALGLRLPYPRAVSRLAKAAADPRTLVLIARREGSQVGVLACRLERILFLDEQQIRLLYLYVEPEHRLGVVAARLLHAMLAWGRAKRVAAIVGEVGGGDGATPVHAMLKRRGIAVAGNVFRMVY